ncbi:MAG: adenylyltransferase/cytidyltransferase family protein [Bacilli bacterium]|nr:adenylyltransferase/cytidyltransferase family protein [Bacilli bacterium]
MKIFNINCSIDNYKFSKFKKKTNLCLGFFDGVHLGHKLLIKKAKAENDNVAIVTFDNFKKKCLTTVEERLFFFKKMNINCVFIFDFKKIKDVPYDIFKKSFLDVINLNSIFIGNDFKFGKNRLGKANYLKKFFIIKTVSFLKKNNKKISSSEIKKIVKHGDIKTANQLLGYNFCIFGNVIKKNKKDLFVSAQKDKILPPSGDYKMSICSVKSSNKKNIIAKNLNLCFKFFKNSKNIIIILTLNDNFSLLKKINLKMQIIIELIDKNNNYSMTSYGF